MNRPLRLFLRILGVFAVIIGGLFLFVHIAFDGIFTGPVYDSQDLKDNYEKRKLEIKEVKSFVVSKIPTDTFIEIEFENGDLGIFHVKKNGIYESNWNLEIDAQKTDSLLKVIGWTKTELKILKEKLDDANCISVSSGQPITIGWQRSGMGKLSYNIFDQKLNDSLITQYNDGCNYIYYKDNVVLEYGGGAVGPQCFPGFDRKY